MTLSDQDVLNIVNALLDYDHDPWRGPLSNAMRIQKLRERSAIAAVRALGPLVDRYLAIVAPPRTCPVEHDHWEGRMVCGRELPCPRHGGTP